MIFKDELNTQSDKRKLNKLVDEGVISASELANAPILSVSECCGADMLGEPGVAEVTCEKCGKPCVGAVDEAEDSQ